MDRKIERKRKQKEKAIYLYPACSFFLFMFRLGYVLKLQCANLALYLMYLIFLTVLALSVTPYQRCPEFYNFQDPDSVSARKSVDVYFDTLMP